MITKVRRLLNPLYTKPNLYVRLEQYHADYGWTGLFRDSELDNTNGFYSRNKKIIADRHLPPQREDENFEILYPYEMKFAFTLSVYQDVEMARAITNLTKLSFIRLLLIEEKMIDIIWRGPMGTQIAFLYTTLKKEVMK